MITRIRIQIPVAMLAVVLVVTSMSLQSGVAAPGAGAVSSRLAAQNVDWMSPEQATQLDLGFTVLVPSWVPGPFGGSPSIQASGGYYSLYWMIPGGSPTFLQVTGEVGGALPAGSPADLNNQLFINASVQGYDAIHDVTSIYDSVWWIAGGVLYTVSSNNMTGSDSLSLANSLIGLEQPAAPAPDPVEEEPTEVATEVVEEEPAPEGGPSGTIGNPGSVTSGSSATLSVFPSEVGTLRATGGFFTGSGETFITDLTGGEVAWQAPSVSSETTVEFTLLDAQTGVVTDTSSIVVLPSSDEGESSNETDVTDTTTSLVEGITAEPTAEDGSAATADGSGGSSIPTQVETPVAVQTPASGGTNGATLSDGTAGPQLPSGSDGTGGIRMVTIP